MSVRLFSILAILATGLIAIKALSITDEVLVLLDPAQPAWASSGKDKKHKKEKKEKKHKKAKKDKSHDKKAKGHGKSNKKEAKAAPKSAPNVIASPDPVITTRDCKASSFADNAGLSEQELRLVLRLSERREELDAREYNLKTREGVVALSEKQLDERLQKIETAIAKFDKRIGLLDEQEAVRMRSVVKTYESMKPKSAATIFNALNDQVLLQVATRMKPQAMAKVLAAMKIERATELTQRMSEQFARPASAQALLDETKAPAKS